MRRYRLPLAIAATALLLIAAAFAADDFGLSWWTVDGGGGVSQSNDGRYTLHASIGQPDAGTLAGQDYTLSGGFWNGVYAPRVLYLPVVVRNAGP